MADTIVPDEVENCCRREDEDGPERRRASLSSLLMVGNGDVVGDSGSGSAWGRRRGEVGLEARSETGRASTAGRRSPGQRSKIGAMVDSVSAKGTGVRNMKYL